MNNQVSYFIIASDISTDNSEIMMNVNDNKEPNDVYEANIEPESITIKMEITPPNPQINELKPNSTAVMLSTEKVIIKEELDIEEMLYDESAPNWDVDVDPLAPDTETETETEKLECEICGGNFKQSRQLDNHLFIMHRPLTVAGTGAYCNKCNKWFAEFKYPNHNPCFNYMRSIQNGKKMHSCEVCDRDFTAVSLLKAHLVEAHRPRIAHESVDISEVVEEKIICKICEAEFPIKRGLIQHLTLIHRPYTFNTFNLKEAYCTRCQSCFTEDKFIDHGPCISPLQNIPVFRCHICNNEFQLLHLLKTHLYVIHRPLTLQYSSDAFCDKCNRWFKEDNYTMHKCVRRNAMLNTDNNNDKYKCAICSKIFETDAELKKHLYDAHRPIVTDDFCNIFCDFCKNTFVEDEFEGHVPCHSVDSKCMFCLICMPSKNHYLLHDLTWKKWRSYQCNMCDLNTQEMRLANLNEHMMTCHGKKSIFQCVKCKFEFISTENAQAHIESIHFGCRCVMDPCACTTYNYDYYYEFVKQRNITDFRGNSKNLLENEITIIREEQYNSIEADIDVCHMKTDVNKLENSDLNNLNFQTEYDQPGGLINNFSMPSTSTSATTIVEDFSSLLPGTSKIVDIPQLRANYRQVTPKTEYKFDNEDPDEKRKRLNREKQRRWRERQRKENPQPKKRRTIYLKEEKIPEQTITIEDVDDESSQDTNYLLEEDPVERKKRLNREKQQRWRQRRSEALDRIWEEKIEKQFQSQSNKEIPETVPETVNPQCLHSHMSEDQNEDDKIETPDEDEDPQLRKKRLSRERQSRWRNKKTVEALEQIRKTDAERHVRKRAQETFEKEEARRADSTQAQGSRRALQTQKQVDMRRKANNEVQARRRAKETSEKRQIANAQQQPLENPAQHAVDALQLARRTGQQSDEEIRQTARRIAKDIPEQIKPKRFKETMNNQQELSSQSENCLDEFFDMIMDRWS